MKKFRSKYIHPGHTGKRQWAFMNHLPTYQPSEYLFTDCYIPSQGSDLYDAQLTETLLWFSARKSELWKMISNEQPREWHRLPVTTCFRSKTTQVNNLNQLIGEVLAEAEIAKTYCLHSLLVNACP